MRTSALLQPNNNRESTPRLHPQQPRLRNRRKQSNRPPRNNSSNRKRKQEPRTNRVSTPSNEHFLHAWTLADTRSSDSLGLSPGKRLTGPGIFLLLYKIPQCKPAIGFVEQSNFKRLDLRI